MAKKTRKILLSILLAFGIVAVLAYLSVPLVRYLFLPITGSTQAPSLTEPQSHQSLNTEQEKLAESKQFVVGTLSNASEVVQNIDQVPVQGGWINTSPLNIKQLQKQNKVILIDFWTYTCINCIRATPYAEELWQRYKDHGLVIIGVHSPEFEIEKNPANIDKAVKRLGITYPVLTDGDRGVWNAFGNHFWPAVYLINPKGKIVYTKFGEGNYDREENEVRHALEEAGWKLPNYGSTTEFLSPIRVEQTEELYAGPGFIRRGFGNKNQPHIGTETTFTLPATIESGRINLAGKWLGTTGYMQSLTPGQIVLKYFANTPYVVMGPAKQAVTVTVLWEGKPVPKQYQGKDIQNVDGKTVMQIDTPRLYYPLSSDAPYGHYTIEFMVPVGLRLWSFTFGSY